MRLLSVFIVVFVNLSHEISIFPSLIATVGQDIGDLRRCSTSDECSNGAVCTIEGVCEDKREAVEILTDPNLIHKAETFSLFAEYVEVDPSIGTLGRSYSLCYDNYLLYSYKSKLNVKFSLYRGPEYDILTFKGTTTLREAILDLHYDMTKCTLLDGKFCGMVHAGFQNAFKSISTQLYQALSIVAKAKRPLVITGHSLGAALAYFTLLSVFGSEWRNYLGIMALYTFGCPKQGDIDYVQAFEDLVPASIEIVRFVTLTQNNPQSTRDIVSTMPPGAFSHCRPYEPAMGIVCSVDGTNKKCSLPNLHRITNYRNSFANADFYPRECLNVSLIDI